MKMIIVPGFLGYAQETHHMELKSKMESLGHEAIVIESIELAQLDFANYRFSRQLREVEKYIDLNPYDQFAVVGVSMGGVVW